MDTYEKKYNDALERARALWQEAIEKEYPNDYLKDYETIFPELRKSEDERIRRTLVEYFGPKVQLDFVRGIPIQKIRDWLDKQKEQKQTDLPAGFYFIDQNGNRYYSKEFRYGDMKLKVGEQKPAGWSEGNKQWLDAIIKDYEDSLSGDEDHDPAIQIKINLLKSLRPDTFQNGNSRPKTSDNWKNQRGANASIE